MNKIKNRVFEIIEVAKEGDILSKIFDISIITLIVFNILFFLLSTIQELNLKFTNFFYYFELVSVIIFTIEYVLRIWTCEFIKGYENGIKGKIKFIFTPMLLLDLFAFLPFYVPFLIKIDLRFLRIFRLFRIFRIFKLGRYSYALKTIGNVIKSKKEELLMSIFVLFILLIFSSCLMYYIENEFQPDKFKNVFDAMWWSVATLTTVGYGDIYPVTNLGKLLGSFIALLGIGFFALPTGIIASGFAEEIKKREKEKVVKCPFCGNEFNINN